MVCAGQHVLYSVCCPSKTRPCGVFASSFGSYPLTSDLCVAGGVQSLMSVRPNSKGRFSMGTTRTHHGGASATRLNAVFSPPPPHLPVAVSDRRLLRALGDVPAGGHCSAPPHPIRTPPREGTNTRKRLAVTQGRVGAPRRHRLPAVQQAGWDGRRGARCWHGPTRGRRCHLVERGRSAGGGERRGRAAGKVRRGGRPARRGRRPSRPCRRRP